MTRLAPASESKSRLHLRLLVYQGRGQCQAPLRHGGVVRRRPFRIAWQYWHEPCSDFTGMGSGSVPQELVGTIVTTRVKGA